MHRHKGSSQAPESHTSATFPQQQCFPKRGKNKLKRHQSRARHFRAWSPHLQTTDDKPGRTQLDLSVPRSLPLIFVFVCFFLSRSEGWELFATPAPYCLPLFFYLHSILELSETLKTQFRGQRASCSLWWPLQDLHLLLLPVCCLRSGSIMFANLCSSPSSAIYNSRSCASVRIAYDDVGETMLTFLQTEER